MNLLYTGTILFWFSPAIEVIFSIIFRGKQLNIIHYSILFISILFILIYEKFRINKNVMVFFLFFLIIASLNLIFVPYIRYVLAESISIIFKITAPLLIFSYIDNEEFEKIIYLLMKSSIVFSIIMLIILLSQSWIYEEYGLIANLVIYNMIPLNIGCFKSEKYKPLYILLFCINFFVLFFFGSRMPALAACVTFFVSFFVLQKKKTPKKYIFIIITGILIFTIAFNIQNIFGLLETILLKLGIYSRTVTRFTNELGNLSLLDMMQSSHRNEIWDLAKKYIFQRHGLPGGFAVTRYLTHGTYYFSHNFFYDMALFFGGLALPIIIYILVKLIKSKKKYSQIVYLFVICCFSSAFCQSMTGGYFWDLTQWICVWGVLIFFKERKKNENKKITL